MPDLTRQQVDQMDGLVLLEFGASWCPLCQRLQPILQAVLANYPQVQHVAFEDGPGQPLERSFSVKLWLTLVLLRDGEVVEQLVRSTSEAVHAGLATLIGDYRRL